MCGIFGTINLPVNQKDTIPHLIHRGPDSQTTWCHNNLTLQHFRLSILDIDGGVQPMHLLDRYTIVFNGEIYNHHWVRKKLDLDCQSDSDTETILRAYHKMGISCLDYFDGMFVFVIYDKVTNKLLLVRDRAGKKPLYLYKENNQIAFASELKVLNKIVRDKICEESIYEYLHFGYMVDKTTPFQNVKEISSGTYTYIDCESLESITKKYWDISVFYQKDYAGSYEEAVKQVDDYLRNGIRRRLLSSDLEVGSFLSGGIDSGLVTSIASEMISNPLKTFTVRFDGEYDESPLAQKVSERYNTDHNVIDISFDNLKDEIDMILTNYGEPFMDSSAIPSYYVSREAKKYITVVLNGDGADELFGGYRRYVPYRYYPFLSTGNLQKELMKMVNSILPHSNNKRSKYNFVKRLFTLGSQNGLEQYQSATFDVFTGYEDVFLKNQNNNKIIQNKFQEIINNSNSDMKAIMHTDFSFLLFSDLLVKMDIATMANSLEGRSPFLCKELLEFVPQLPNYYLIKGNYTKRILRDLGKKYLPFELIRQPKRGFEIPLKSWVENELHDKIWDNIGSTNSYVKNFIKADSFNILKKKNGNLPAEKRAKMIWSLFALETWYKNL